LAPTGEEQLTLLELDEDDSFDPDVPAAVPPDPPVNASTDEPIRLRRLWFRNFKGFEAFEVELGEFNVLAGPNNAGKSSLLQGADLLFRLIDLHREGNHLVEGRNVPLAILPVAVLRDLWYRQRNRQQNKHVPATVGGQFSNGTTVEFGVIGPFGAATSKLLTSEDITDAWLESLAARPAVWVPSSVGVVRDEEYRTPARRSSLVNAGRHNEVLRNLLLELVQHHPDEFAELQDILERYFQGHFAQVSFDERLDQFVTATYEEGDARHDLFSVGAGFVQVVQLLAFVLLRSPGLILLDEPDAHLHSSLQRTVVDVLDDLSHRRGMQVVLSTHSKEIINYVDPTRLILVEKGSDTASPFGPQVSQLVILKSLGAIDSVDAYALFRNRRCLFVEGTSDNGLLLRLAAKLGVAVLTGDERVVMVPVGGADRFEHVEQLNVIEALLGDTIRSLEIRDRDGMTDEHRQGLMDDAPRPLHILDRDSIESYLVSPEVIARVIVEVASERGDSIEVDRGQIEAMALEETEAMKVAAVDRVAARWDRDTVRTTSRHRGIEAANAAARDFVDANWGTLSDRLRVVHGKRLLAALRKRVQDEFKVSFGDKRLVEAFQESEIPPELVELMRRVAELGGDT
jgi:energy-coupling factor transporter ATP-binding protein EcfA2